MKRILGGLGSLVVLVLLVLGIPAGLIAVAGNPIPSFGQIMDVFSMPDWGGQFLIGSLLPIVGWCAWGAFIIPFLASIPSALKEIRSTGGAGRAQHRGPFKLQRRSAIFLVGMILAMGGGGQAAMAAPAEGAPALVAQQISGAQQSGATSEAGAPQSAAPSAAAPSSLQQAIPKHVTVAEGDTLFGIAEAELGDGNRYPDLFQASAATVQPDGMQMSDPNVIHPGWQVTIPGAVAPATAPTAAPSSASPSVPAEKTQPTAPPPHASDMRASEGHVDQAQSAPAGATGTVQTPATPAPGSANSSQPSPEAPQSPKVSEHGEKEGASAHTAPAAAEASTEEAGDLSPSLFAAGSIAGLLAAGLLGGLGVRRGLQRRARRRAERIAMPEGETALLEAQMREVENPLATSDVDLVCRYLTEWAGVTESPLPELLAIRLAPEERQISIFLMEPATLPVPFMALSEDQMAWQIRDLDIEALETSTAAGAYPALVTLGKDKAGGHILVDVEQWGEVAILGDRNLAVAAATAAVLELAHSSWTEETRLHLVGAELEIPDILRNGHCLQHATVADALSEIRSQVAAKRASLEAHERAGVHEARAAEPEESWGPEIVVVANPDEPGMEELRELASSRPRLGVVSLTLGGSSTAAIRIDSADVARFEPVGLEFQPQLISPEALAQLEAVMAVTEESAVPLAEDLEHSSDPSLAPDPRDEIDLDHDDGQKAEPSTVVPITEKTEEDGIEKPTVLESPKHEEAHLVDVQQEEPERPRPAAPYVRVLGPVTVDPAPGEELGTPPSRSVEFTAFLALHPHSTTSEYAEAFWPNKPVKDSLENRRKLTSSTRKWLGSNAEEELYLPLHEKGGDYHLAPEIRTDWDDFRELVGDDPATASDAALVAAMKLVRSQPFAGIKTRFYTWAELDKERMVSLIADVAEELFHRAFSAGDNVNARYFASIGRNVQPENEAGARNLLRIALSSRDPEEFERQVNALMDGLENLGEDLEPDLETRVLIEQGREQLAVH